MTPFHTSGDITIHLVTPDKVLTHWNDVRKYLQDALDYADGRYLIEDIQAYILTGKWVLMVITDHDEIVGAGAFCVDQFPRKTVLRVCLLGGSQMQNWLDVFIESLDMCAEICGADTIDLHGRKGWTKALKNTFGVVSVVMTREI